MSEPNIEDTAIVEIPAEEEVATEPVQQVRRGLKVGYLVAGLLCLGVVAIWALGISETVDTSSFAWLVPAVLIVAGLGGLAAAVLGQRPRR